VKLGIKEKGEEEGCRERKVHILNKWWEIMIIYSKEMKTTRRRVEEAIKKTGKIVFLLLRWDFNGRVGERGERNW
jgi:hypothetical protein